MAVASKTTMDFRSSPGGCLPVIHFPVTVPPTRTWSCNNEVTCGSRLSKTMVKKDKIQSATGLTQIMIYDEEKDQSHQELVEKIRLMLKSMKDGEISLSPYDTAWVAMVEDIGGSEGPQFPSAVDWILNNQLSDGSWGDPSLFLAHDRILNTLACVVALKFWDIHSPQTDKGISFMKKNIHRLEDENPEHMTLGFEVTFPSLFEIARKLGINLSDDSVHLQRIYASRDLKLSRIPKDLMHKVPTSLLYSLEGMPNLEWQRLLKLQCCDGSFLFSPASTAFALHHTKDAKCLKYLKTIVDKFNGGVPNVYPVDLFEHYWAIDRLQRLGISHYFHPEIEVCMNYGYRYWNNKGIFCARNSEFPDIDCTAMGFRLLRLYGYEVSADVFNEFRKDGEFFCIAGQSSQAVTGMYNLYRASQVMFPGEEILMDAMNFSSKFLQEKRANNEILDKWIITKDLPGEVGYALEVPWYASLPRLETRFYLEQYGGENDVWIGKTLYRMYNVNNNTYLELAKLDYNQCQAMHQLEWKDIQRWYESFNLEDEHGLSNRSLLMAYYISAASIFEPQRSNERIFWAKTKILMETILTNFHLQQLPNEHKHAFVDEFCCMFSKENRYTKRQNLGQNLTRILNQLWLYIVGVQNEEIRQPLYRAWQKWLRTWANEGKNRQDDSELIVCTLNLIGCKSVSENLMSHCKYQQLLNITNRVCRSLKQKHQKIFDARIQTDMQELVKLVLTKSSDDLDFLTKQNFLVVAKSFYYSAYCDPTTINFHIKKAEVLFDGSL